MELVEFLAQSGIDALKLYVGLELEHVRALVAAARGAGLLVLGHFGGKVTLRDAARAGVDEVEHLAGAPSPFDPSLVDEIAEWGTWVVPTQVVWEEPLRATEDPRGFSADLPYVCRRTRGQWDRFAREQSRDDPGFGRLRDFCAVHREYIRGLVASRARLAVGTDAACLFCAPGSSYHRELRVLCECGMSNIEAIGCATKHGAELLGLAGEIGAVTPGSRADLLLVRGNPMEDISTLRDLVWVMKSGRVRTPAQILAESDPASLSSGTFPDPMDRAEVCEDWREGRRRLRADRDGQE